jgi:hypothetical protein
MQYPQQPALRFLISGLQDFRTSDCVRLRTEILWHPIQQSGTTASVCRIDFTFAETDCLDLIGEIQWQ